MKKILLFASALAGLFFAASCQQENLEPVAGGNTVTYTVQIPDAIGTKAVGDDVKNANVLHYEVYRTKNAETKIFSEEDNLLYHKAVEANEDGTFTIVLELINNQNFTVLLWAQHQESLKDGENLILENEAYNVENLTNVTINTLLKANQLDYAAFAGHHFIKANVKDTKKVIELHRPVAQLNIGTTAESLTAFNDPVVLKKSSVSVEGLSNTYNVATKAAGAVYNEAISYGVQPVLKKANDEYETFTAGTTTYPYVGMNYVGFAATEGSTIKVSYFIETSEGDITNTINNVPVKANYRTNIIGNLITATSDYKITLDSDWADEPDEPYVVEVVSVSTAAGLQEAIDDIPAGTEGNIKLEGNIDLGALVGMISTKAGENPYGLLIPAGKTIILDLNGCTLTGVDETEISFGLITNKGNLTIVNSAEGKTGKINLNAMKNDPSFSRYSSVISTQPGSTLTVGAGVEIEHFGGTSMSYGIDVLTNGKGTSAVAVIDGATVKSTYRAIRQFLNGTEANNSLTVKSGSVIESKNGNKSIWMQDPSANANTGSLVVEEGAELYGNVYISATAGSTEWPVSASVAASALKDGSKVEISPKELVGYNVVLNDGVYVFEQSWSVDGDEYFIFTAYGLKWVAEQVNTMEFYVNSSANIFDGKTVYLENDIDLGGSEWTPIGDYAFSRTSFNGVFDGKNHTVSNFKVTELVSWTEKVTEASYGLFGNVKGTIKNLTVKDAIVAPNGGRYSAVLVGRLHNGANIENCHVKSSSATIEHWQVGGIVGQNNNGNIRNCSISGSTITGMAAVGAIVGMDMVAGEHSIENCRVENSELVQNESLGESYDSTYGLAVGLVNASGIILHLNNVVVENNTIKGVSSDVLVGENEAGSKIIIDGYEILAPGLAYNKTLKTYAVSSADGLVAMSDRTIKAGESVVLTADIDLAGVEFNGLSAFNPENNNTFDGQRHKVSNWTNEGGASDMAFIKGWVGTIKNVTIENASLKTGGRSAVLAANVYANIENCHVVNSSIEDSYWACGIIAGLYNSGSITNCSVDDCSVKSNGGVGGIVGVINESAGERIINGCTVKNTTVNNTGAYGEAYSGALMAGMFNAGDATYKFIKCTLENNTKEGQYVGDLFYSAEGETVYVDGVQQ
ncbi:MAG: GLUG motif-containing protein [Bacteroidales bacterium]|nr:GLUG motif-containing protein [Bacteroidales bacterium]